LAPFLDLVEVSGRREHNPAEPRHGAHRLKLVLLEVFLGLEHHRPQCLAVGLPIETQNLRQFLERDIIARLLGEHQVIGVAPPRLDTVCRRVGGGHKVTVAVNLP
jgi:hypothetical protein